MRHGGVSIENTKSFYKVSLCHTVHEMRSDFMTKPETGKIACVAGARKGKGEGKSGARV